MEKSNIITRIIKKFLSGRFSAETEEKVQRWIMKEENAEEKEKASLEYWNELDAEADSKTHSALERVNLRTGYNKEHLENIVLYHKFVRIVAVVIPICLLAGGVLYYIPSGNEQIEISTAYGEQKRLVLPDSSEVWLNAGSTITYPETFTKENRVVTLDGEAYFSVRKDDAKPFIVETSQLSVKVLGTKFNVKAYANDANITTTLTSGKVEVSTQSRPPQTLKPNERLTYDKSTSDIEISTVDTVDTNSWVKGKIIFTNATAEEIFRTLERRYDTVIDHSADFSAPRRYTVKFLKDENLDEMLNSRKEGVLLVLGVDNFKNINTKYGRGHGNFILKRIAALLENSIDENIKIYRQKKGYTQEDVANRLHVTRQTISKWEKNYSVPDVEVFVKLADVLEVQTSQLLEVKVGSDVQTTEEKQNAYAEQLAHIAEQMAIRNRQRKRIWKTIGITFAVIIVIYIILIVMNIAFFSVYPTTEDVQTHEETIMLEE